LRPRPKGPEAEAEARGYEAEAKISRGQFGLEALTSLCISCGSNKRINQSGNPSIAHLLTVIKTICAEVV